MQEFGEKLHRQFGWGAATSVVLHSCVIFLLLFHLPAAAPKPPQEQPIPVKVVPPPPEPKSAPQPPPPPPAKSPAKDTSKPMQAFESAAAKVDQKETGPSPAPAGDPEAKVVTPTPDNPNKPDTATAENNAEAKPVEPVQQLAAVNPAKEPGETGAPEIKMPPQTPQPKPLPDTRKTPKPAKPASSKGAGKLVAARELYSPKALFDPRVLQAIGNLPPKGRIKQLCMIEALEQIRRQRPGAFPDILVPYGETGGAFTDYALNARGGAFRSRSDWYNVDFKCRVDADRAEVVSFSIAIGDMVPKSEWPARQFPLD